MPSSHRGVSVVITSYNQKDYLVEAVESVIQQTVKPCEIIIADDHSEDGSVNLIQEYIARHPGWIRGVFHKENVGISRNRNAALRQATGSHVAMLDGDDRLLERNLEVQLRALEEQPGAGCAYTNLFYINAQGIRTRIRDKRLKPSGDIFAYVAAGQMGLLRSMLIRYDLMRKAGFLDPRFPKYDGFILTLHLAKLTQFAYVIEPLAEYRVHDKGDSRSFSHRENLRYLTDVFLELIQLSRDLKPLELEQIRTVWFWELLRRKVRAEIEEQRKMKALLHVARGFLRNPKRVRRFWHLAREILA